MNTNMGSMVLKKWTSTSKVGSHLWGKLWRLRWLWTECSCITSRKRAVNINNVPDDDSGGDLFTVGGGETAAAGLFFSFSAVTPCWQFRLITHHFLTDEKTLGHLLHFLWRTSSCGYINTTTRFGRSKETIVLGLNISPMKIHDVWCRRWGVVSTRVCTVISGA